MESRSEGVGNIGTDWEKAGVSQDNFDEKMSTGSGNMNRRYMTQHIDEPVTIQGSVCVEFKAALSKAGKSGESSEAISFKDFSLENVNDADKLSFALTSSADRMDDIKLTVLLCDLANEEFDSIQTTDPERNVVPTVTVSEGSLPLGGSLPALDIKEFQAQHRTWNVITRAYLDLCNPDSGYEPETAASSITLIPGEAHEYHAYLNAARYTVAPGHRIAVVIGTEDPVNCLVHKKYSVAIDDSSIRAALPVTEVTEPFALYAAE
jgi:X-Pro dipeptidyl-peptidase